MTRRPRYAAAGMSARSAVIKPFERRAVIGIAQSGTRPEQLVKRQSAVKYIASGQPEDLLEIERSQSLPADDARLEPRRIVLDRLDHEIGDTFPIIVP